MFFQSQEESSVLHWIAIQSFNQDVASVVATAFGIPMYAMQEGLSGSTRPNFEAHGDKVSVVSRGVRQVDDETVVYEQITCFILPNNVLITIAPAPQPVFASLRRRIERGQISVTGRSSAYLACVVLDAITSEYFSPLERYGDRLEELEIAIIDQPSPAVSKSVYAVKRELSMLRRAIWPTREMWTVMRNSGHDLFTDQPTLDRMHNAYEHVLQVRTGLASNIQIRLSGD